MSVKQDLQAARDLISDPAHWTQKVKARDITGAQCNSDAPEAVSFCMYGAISHVTQDQYACVAALRQLCDRPIHYNDTHSHAEVLDLLDRVITSLPEDNT